MRMDHAKNPMQQRIVLPISSISCFLRPQQCVGKVEKLTALALRLYVWNVWFRNDSYLSFDALEATC